jgi:hypothetical protein
MNYAKSVIIHEILVNLLVSLNFKNEIFVFSNLMPNEMICYSMVRKFSSIFSAIQSYLILSFSNAVNRDDYQRFGDIRF